jgi:predicted nucleotidyltransferase
MASASSPASIHQDLSRLLIGQDGLEFAVLVGSRATGRAHEHSDWDIAVQWQPTIGWLSAVARTEQLRRALAVVLRLDESEVDLIDLRRANLAMRAAVAEEGIPLCGDDSLAWQYFLKRTWRDLEDFYWEQRHAA